MSIAQRGTSATGLGNGDNGYHTCDRWSFRESGSPTWEFTMSQDTDVPTGQGFVKSLKMDCTTADASLATNDMCRIQQSFEGQNLQYLKFGTSSAQSTTISFWVKSNKTGNYNVSLLNNDQSRIIGNTYTISSADTWEKKTITFAGDTAGAFDNDNNNSLSLWWGLLGGTDRVGGDSSSWGANADNKNVAGQTVNLADSTSNEWYLTGVQFEAGSQASDFEFLPFDVNLQRCLRYFQDMAPKKNDCRIAIGENVSGQRCDPVLQYVEKRANPSVTFTAANTFSLYNANTSRDCTSMSADNFSEICGNLNANVSSGLTPTGGASQFITNGTGSQIFVDAEL
tara:strand:- start:158 stop:1177 length:1020 start_codon:yes stop_codon:yes gene_type:complete